ncbi:ANTAR domain-containing protein [Streptomyces sp. NPDC060188]|uniref:ANTAR domain-containing protein n=1 Tax=Streptomyces sp. NPDC060188 TaxID=3347068 RepID=UPI0036602CA7
MTIHANGKPTPGPSQATTAHRTAQLTAENAQLQHAVHSHAVVDQAIGVLLAVGELTPDEGWDVLREVPQRTNIKLRHVSELIIDSARTGRLPSEVRTELDAQLAAHRPSPRPDPEL